MYMIDDMIDLGLSDGGKWPSAAHRKVASTVLLCNRDITTRTDLMECVKIINRFSEEEIKGVTIQQLRNLGVPIP